MKNADSLSAFRDRLDELVSESLEMEDLNVAYLADRMYMSHSTLFRRVKQATGTGANEYIRNKRLERAAFLLQDDKGGGRHMTICNIAYSCGFASHSSFAKAFRKRYGISAVAYREKNKLDNQPSKDQIS